ncbi:MAG: thiol-disulfide oxidoreductase DCC family protein [Porticoccus sp.]|jgi:predicted DCC family thiol-disulfide oxidoreductase YuxK
MTNFFNDKSTKDTLFFDGSCPMCTKEIKLLEDINDGSLAFMDVHKCDTDDSMPSQLDMLKVLHLRTAEGEWIKGVPATVQAWSHTRWGWVFKPLLWPLVNHAAAYAYNIWAEKRYRRLYDCDTCVGNDQ